MALSQRYEEVEAPFLDKGRYTEDEYFALEDRSPDRWEFIPTDVPGMNDLRVGLIRAMSGGMPDHAAIMANLITALTLALRDKGNRMCRVFSSDLKVHNADGRNTYPDVSVVCGTLSHHRRRRDIVTNPILVAEVLSPSTQAGDRGAKRLSYQTVPTLRHVLLLAADRPHVELYTREEDGGRWESVTAEGNETSIVLSGLDLTLALADLYDLVEFDEEEPGDPDDHGID